MAGQWTRKRRVRAQGKVGKREDCEVKQEAGRERRSVPVADRGNRE